MRNLLAQGNANPIYGVLGPRRPEAYHLTHPPAPPAWVLGPYQTNIGGCDRIQPYDLILELLDKYAARGSVVFEGVIISDNWGRVGAWLSKRSDSAIVFLDTPVSQCIGSVMARTAGAGLANVERRARVIERVRAKVVVEGKVRVIGAGRDTALSVIMGLLGWI